MTRAVVRVWLRVVLLVSVGLPLHACLDAPEFQQVGNGSSGSSSPSGAVTTPPSSAESVTSPDGGASGDAGAPPPDDGDDPTNYVPDGGVAGPGTSVCGRQTCATDRVCCKDKCKPPKSKC